MDSSMGRSPLPHLPHPGASISTAQWHGAGQGWHLNSMACAGPRHTNTVHPTRAGGALAVGKAAFSRMAISRPLEPKPSPAAQAKTSKGALSLIKAADSRVLALEAELRRSEGELQARCSCCRGWWG